MQVRKLFNVLVLGGAIAGTTAGCRRGQPAPQTATPPARATGTDEPAAQSPPEEKQQQEQQQPAAGGGGVQGW